ncbi:MAG: glycoside hydrolase family 38 C-terminal domain-containing protein, partial [Promethearchaeota archaeon]
KDELYYEFHRGSLTTQTLLKRMNRYFEWNLPAAEGFYTIAKCITSSNIDYNEFKDLFTHPDDQSPTTSNPIEQIWQNVLLMQFHDVLSGTSLPKVYDECYEFWSQDKPILESIKSRSLEMIGQLAHGAGNLNDFELVLQAPIEFSDPDSDDLMTVIKVFVTPVLIGNGSGARFDHLAEIPVRSLPGKFVFAVLTPRANNNDDAFILKPVQLVDADEICAKLDVKPRRWIFHAEIDSWTTSLVFLLVIPISDVKTMYSDEKMNEIARTLFDVMDSRGKACKLDETADFISISNGSSSITINKRNGAVVSLYHDNACIWDIKNAGGARLKTYKDKPYREPCWNLMRSWWTKLVEVLDNPENIALVESGPVRWCLELRYHFGFNDFLAKLRYYLSPSIPGINVEIALDYHETETLVKYEIPMIENSQYSWAETPYAISRRRNKPLANHDKPRWEKWCHCFVAMENADQNIGIAVINEGRFGFDTLNNTLGISIVHGPRYPEPNVVAWIKDERLKRKNEGLGEPPTHADQGPHLTRLYLLPYKGSWMDAKIHHFAHAFNSSLQLVPLGVKNDSSVEIHSNNSLINKFGKQILIKDTREIPKKIKDDLPILINSCTATIHWARSSLPCVEITVLKPAESLPPIMDPKFGRLKKAVVVRAVNNSNQPCSAWFQFDTRSINKNSKIIEVDLLERPIIMQQPLNFKVPRSNAQSHVVTDELQFKPHEIRTFKIILKDSNDSK